MNSIEDNLVNTSKIPANSGHSLHKGTPREAFIKEFLENHLSENVAIGTGEIIDSDSKPGEKRNQYDIVIYKKNYPKLHFGAGINGFLIESVIATIEVKSTLDQSAIDQAINAAYNAKKLTSNIKRSITTGWKPIKVLSYVVAYSGPAKMLTVYNWIENSHKKQNIPLPVFTEQNRRSIPGTALDGIFILHRGFIKLDNTSISLNNPQSPEAFTHVVVDTPINNIINLFFSLQEACFHVEGEALDPIPYLKNASYNAYVI